MKTVIVLFVLPLLVSVGACTEETGNQQHKDSPAIQEAQTEPLEFRMTVDPTSSLKPPSSEELSKDTLLLRTPDGNPARYGIESALIQFEISGDKSGTFSHIFKDYGRYERVVDSTMPVEDRGSNFANHYIAITTPEFTGRYDYLTKYGWKMPSSDSYYLDSADSQTMSLTDFSLKQVGAKRIGDTVINGYQTRVYRIEDNVEITTLWMWRGIPIRRHSFLPLDDLEFLLNSVSIEVNPKITDETFAFPKGVHIQKRDAPPPPGAIPPPMPGPAPSTHDDGEGK